MSLFRKLGRILKEGRRTLQGFIAETNDSRQSATFHTVGPYKKAVFAHTFILTFYRGPVLQYVTPVATQPQLAYPTDASGAPIWTMYPAYATAPPTSKRSSRSHRSHYKSAPKIVQLDPDPTPEAKEVKEVKEKALEPVTEVDEGDWDWK